MNHCYRSPYQTICRQFLTACEAANWLPTKKGVSFPRELVGEAVDALEKLANRDSVAEIAEILRGEKAKTCFAIREFQHHTYGEIRTFYREQKDGEWKFGKGVTIPLAMLGKLAEALNLAEDQLSRP